MKVVLIINPISGTRSKQKFLQHATQQLQKSDIEWQIVETQHRHHATEIARQAAHNGVNLVVAVGGDGTVNEVAQGLIDTDIPMAIIPTGSGNGFARHIKTSLSPIKALDRIIAQQYKVISADCGFINGNLFLCTSGVGFDADISNRYSQLNKSGHRGLTTYIRAAITGWFRDRNNHFTISIDDKLPFETDALLVTIANASQYGNNAYIAPEASIRDQQLDVVIIKPISIYHIPALAYRLFSRTLNKSRHISTIKCSRVTIDANVKRTFHFDGDNGEISDKFVAEIRQKAIKIAVPD